MPKLRDLLADTLLGSVDGGARSDQWPAESANKFWKFSTESLRKVTSLSCIAPHSHGGSHQAMYGLVCTHVEWSDVKVTLTDTDGQKREIILPLTDEYRLASELTKGGKLDKDKNHRWPLELDIDLGIQNTFGFEWSEKQVKKLKDPKIEDDNFFYPVAGKSGGGFMQYLGTDLNHLLEVPALRFLVNISLVCCAPDHRFTPGKWANPVRAARVFPLLMIMASRPGKIVSYTAEIELMRPPLGTKDPEGIAGKIHAAGFTDTNDFRLLDFGPTPEWSDIFDWFKAPLTSANQKFVAVYPSTATSAETLAPDTRSDAARSFKDAIMVYDPPGEYKKLDVKKLPGQGEFDNIHIAPAMTSPAEALYKGHGFDAISMAPFCVHDCLHIHWRWGAGLPLLKKWNRGWSGDSAYAVNGRPMVPQHQRVEIELKSASTISPYFHGIRYRAIGHELGGRKWDVVFSHGGAYSYELTTIGGGLKVAMGGARSLPPGVQELEGDSDYYWWAHQYWIMRKSWVIDGKWTRPVPGILSYDRIKFADEAQGNRVRKG